MSGHEGSRKRVKISRTEGKSTSTDMAPVASASTIASSKNVNGCTSASDATCHHEQSLKALHTDLDAMRQLITCKICHRLLYEPYSLSCGHTYCYSCLSQWLVGTHKKTCPDCRAVVTQQPTPSYVIRELVLVFVSRNELLPDGETSEEHHTYVKEEAEVVAKDRGNTDPRTGGLFKGSFKRGRRFTLRPIHDPGDGVYRCPTCNWELEDSFCNQCGEDFDPSFSDYDDSDLSEGDLDHELDDEDAHAVFGVDGHDDFLGDDLTDVDNGSAIGRRSPPRGPGPRPRLFNGLPERRGFGSARVPIDLRSSDDEESGIDDEAEENLRGFVVGDDEINYASSNEDEDTEVEARAAANRSFARRRAPVVISDEEADTAASAGAPPESEPDSDDEGPIARGSQRNRRRHVVGRHTRPMTVSSDEESSEDEANGFASETGATGGFSPLDSSAAGSAINPGSDYDSEPVSSVHPYNDDEDEDDESDDDGWGPLSPI